MPDFLVLVRADLLLAYRYIVYSRWFAVCDRWPEAAACRDKADGIFERVERQYDTWIKQEQ